MKKILLSLFFLLAAALAACAPKPAAPQTLTVMTHDSFAASETVMQQFENAQGVKVSFIQSGDAGSMLNQSILTKDAPLADVLFGVDNAFLSRALGADIFEPYASAALNHIAAEFKLDAQNRALPVDYGDVCINYDTAYFAQNNLPLPQTLEDLTQPQYKNLLVVENPATSSPGLAFLLATRAHFGDGYLDYWMNLKANGVVVVDSWSTAYYTNFSASSGKGAQPLVVSYASSPAAEVFFAESPLSDAPTASIVAPQTCFRQIEFVGILKKTPNRDLAQKFIDFVLSKAFQEDMPLNMFVFPVLADAQLPQVFTQYAQTAQQPAALTADEIAANRDAWIEAWNAAMK